jgi:hypothetical protein
MAKVGILYDNISGNTGDVAIGLSLKKILSNIGVDFDELFPGNFNPDDYDKIIIGGGHLLRPSPDFFYDKFKVRGKHILNAVGILDSPDDLGYLNDYEYITVRSSWDKEKLSYLKKEVHVIPCTTMLLEDLEEMPIAPAKPSLGLHLVPNILKKNEEKQFLDWISSLPYTVYFLPITHYMQDYIYMGKLSSKVDKAVLLPLMNPQEIFTFIGRLDYFISSSLHGGIFSYRHNVPFTLFNYNEKMLYFMKDRGLERYTFTNFAEMRTSFNALLRDEPDYSEKISKDMELLDQHVHNLRKILPSGNDREQGFNKDQNQSIYQIQNLQLQIVSLEAQMNAYERDIEISKREIEDLQNSILKQIKVLFSKGFANHIIPEGSRRRALWGLCLASIHILVNDGPITFLKRLKDFILPKNGKRNGDS